MSNSSVYGYEGFQDLSNIIEHYIEKTENPIEIIEAGAEAFVKDLLKLPKPISNINKSGYTHLIRSFSYKKEKDEVEVGWGKYYGPIVENGSVKMRAREHLKPCWNKNKEKYYKIMLTKMGINT